MTNKTTDQVWADWVVTQDIGHFQELLNAETEDGQYKILAHLLAHEMEQLKQRRFSNSTPIPIPRSASQYRQCPKGTVQGHKP